MALNTLPGSPDEQNLDFIRESMVAIASYADAAVAFTDARDAAGLAYTIRKMIPHVKAAASTTREIIGAEVDAAKEQTA